MRQKMLKVLLWFPMTFVVLIFYLAILSQLGSVKPKPQIVSTSPIVDGNFQVASATTGSGSVLGWSIVAADSRALLLEAFLKEQGSPMAPYAQLIVDKSDQMNIDFRLVVAIAMCESGAGKHMPSSDSFNAWGIAVYTGQLTGATFTDWPHAIDWVATYIKEHYYDKGLDDLKEIGAKWAPPSVETGYSWTNCVESFQSSIL